MMQFSSSNCRKKVYKISMNRMENVKVAEIRFGWTKFKSAWAITASKIVESKFLHQCISSYHRKKVNKFQSNLIEDIEGVAETRFWMGKVYDNITLSKISCTHLHITGRKSTKFQGKLMKDVRGDADTRSQSYGWTDT